MSTTVSKFSLVIDGVKSEDFLIELNGVWFKVDDFTLSQSLMQPNVLNFRMRKGPVEGKDEPQFDVCGCIIGKDIELSVSTLNVEKFSLASEEEKTREIRFKGIIFSASGSRTMSEYSIDVEARSYDALLIDSPSCKSFENMTLNDIVADIVDDYSSLIDAQVDARFTEQLPYTVQYNESNYQFLLRLAQRFGEWLYNDGEHLVFGQLPQGETVTLGYPNKDIPSYSIDMRMQHTAFGYVASSYNAYSTSRKDGVDEMRRSYNTLADSVFNASEERMSKATLQNLHSGGFADTDSRDIVLNVVAKTHARGEKAGMLTYSGVSYCSQLRIGCTLVIEDNFLPDGIIGQQSNINQDEILITDIVHSFTAEETYTNRFTGIPAACDFPPYTNADIFPVAPSCRARVVDNEDPNGLGRVRVQFDWQAQLDDGMVTPWLRISQPYAGGGKGFSFIPEVGEEVMIDFEGGNAERPYVKGTLYNGVGNPDQAWLPGNNQVKAIRTRNGHTIEIHDKGEGGYIRIYDNGKNNYVITYSTDEKLIKLESSGNIELYAKNDIIMHAGHDIQRTADNDIREHAGHDRTTLIDRNDTLTVEANQFVKVNDNKDEQVAHQLQVTAENIREEAQDKLLQYSDTHQQKANQKMAMNAGTQIDIKAAIVKIN